MKPPLDKQGLEIGDQVVNKIRHTLERFKNRLTLKNPRLTERYLQIELRILVLITSVDLFPRSGDSSQISSEYVACFERALPARGFEGKVEGVNFGVGESATECVLHDHSLEVSRERLNADGGTDCDHEAMLVDIVKLVQMPERVIPSLVRLASVDSFYRSLRHSLYFSGRFGFVFRGVVGDREAGRPENLFTGSSVDLREVVGEVIQRGPEIEQSVSSDGRNLSGRIFSLNEIIDLCARNMVVWLEADSIRISLKKCADFPFEITDVLFGPFDFRPD